MGPLGSVWRMSEAVGCGPKELARGGRLGPAARRMVASALACALLAACAPAGPVPEGRISERDEASTSRSSEAAPDEICVRGRITDEGVECQAMRGRDGRLYTLVGDPGEAPAAGSELCVCGRVAELSSCMQGTTVVVTRIGPPDGCP